MTEAAEDQDEMDEMMAAVLELVLEKGRSGRIRNPYVMPAASVMIGLQLMESVVGNQAIANWLDELATAYRLGGQVPPDHPDPH